MAIRAGAPAVGSAVPGVLRPISESAAVKSLGSMHGGQQKTFLLNTRALFGNQSAFFC